ncbi:MAG TPA: hypothetical protein VFB13_05075 [Reyranella sp.]|nr:hypothetical protein [Reyranella sp.]
MNYRLVVGLLLASAFPGGAWADWQYTKWGMTPEEVVAASDGKIKMLEKPRPAAPGEVALVEGRYESGDLKFSATFVFRDAEKKSLTLVSLALLDSEKLTCAGVHEALFAKYGEPGHVISDRSTFTRQLFWQDRPTNLSIELFRTIKDILCLVSYRPLTTINNRGL